MSGYEQKLREFASGKKLLRLSRPLRNRADAFCDACGSTQPRVLHVLEEGHSGRYYFVGGTCLKELAKMAAILKSYGRESGQKAFEAEVKWRAEELQKKRSAAGAGSKRTPMTKTEAETPDAGPPYAPAPDVWPLMPAVVIIESPEHYEAFVPVRSAQGNPLSWVYAKEPRYSEVWGTGWERGLLLEKVREEHPDALSLCLARAWEEARSHLEGSELQLSTLWPPGVDIQGRNLPGSLLALLKLAPIAPLGSYPVPESKNGGQVVLAPAELCR